MSHLGVPDIRATRRRTATDLTGQLERHWIVRWDVRRSEWFGRKILPYPCVKLLSTGGVIAVHGIRLERSAQRPEGAGMAVGTKFCPDVMASRWFVPLIASGAKHSSWAGRFAYRPCRRRPRSTPTRRELAYLETMDFASSRLAGGFLFRLLAGRWWALTVPLSALTD